MKKIYLLALLCFTNLALIAQPVVTNVYATGAAGSFTTGTASRTGTSYTRSDGDINSNGGVGTIRRGYSVFDLTTGTPTVVPAGSIIMTVTAGMWKPGAPGGAPSGWDTRGYAGNLAFTTDPMTLFNAMVSGPSLSTASYGTAIATGNMTIPSTVPATTFIQSNIGSIVSYCWTGGNTAAYTFTGETGVASTSAALHAPYLTVTYCPRPTGLSATASPDPVCAGRSLSLTGAATGATSYQWTGPGGFTSAVLSPTFTTSLTSAGVYTLTAIRVCGTYSNTATTTTTVGMHPQPAAITGATAVCTGATTTLTNTTTGGTWSSSSAVAAADPATGVISGVSAGAATISYILTSTGCFVTASMDVNDAPAAISGASTVCEASTITLTDASTGGTWSSSATPTATVSSGGVVTGGAVSGPATISYTIPGCPAAIHAVSVNPIPAAITGPASVCTGTSITLSSATAGGIWSSSDIAVAVVGSSSGVVSGSAIGSVDISYSLATGCQVIQAVGVSPTPPAIGGPDEVCVGSNITVTNAFSGGGWTSSAPAVATVGLASGLVNGLIAGTTNITFTMPSGCLARKTVTVNPLPAAITGTMNICQNAVTTLANADAGGTWSSSDVTIASVDASSGELTGTGAGSPTISYTLPTGCVRTTTYTVRPAPSAVITPAGPTTFCAGGDVLLNGTAGTGFRYQWYNEAGIIPGATAMGYTASVTDSYAVVITNTLTCSSTSSSIFVSAAVSPVIEHVLPLEFCAGGNTILSVNTGSAIGSIFYQWQRNGIDVPAATAGSFLATLSGMYTIVVTISGGSGACIVTSPAIAVVVNPLPVPVVTYSGGTLSTGSGYTSYQWFLNTGGLAGATGRTLVPAVNGSYRVKVTDINGCSNYSSAYLIGTVGLQQAAVADRVRIYPNPATSLVHIAATSPVRAIIAGVDGRILIDQVNANAINISALSRGMYIITIYNEQGQQILAEKLVKE